MPVRCRAAVDTSFPTLCPLADFQQHYYSPLCLDQANQTHQKANLLEEFRHQATMASHSNPNQPHPADRFLPSVNSTPELSDLLHPSAPNFTSNLTDLLHDSLLSSLSPANNLSSSASAYNPPSGQLLQNGGGVLSHLATTLPLSANTTTLATIWEQSAAGMQNLTTAALNLIFADLQGSEDGVCRRETSLLFLLLMLGTVWMAVSLFNFNKTYGTKHSHT